MKSLTSLAPSLPGNLRFAVRKHLSSAAHASASGVDVTRWPIHELASADAQQIIRHVIIEGPIGPMGKFRQFS